MAADGSSVLFLRSAGPLDPNNSLWIVRAGEEPVALFDASGRSDRDLTDAERARRERAREQQGGVVSFSARPDNSEVVFSLGGELFHVRDDGEITSMVTDGNVFDPRFESDGSRVAYVSGATLRLTNGETDRLVPGTDEGGDDVSWGSAEFVAAEEMKRGRGFWWSPSGRRLVAARVDTSAVDQWWISSPEQPWSAPRAIRYPAAGTTNADVQLWILDVDAGPERQIDWSRGEFEYLASVQWLSLESRDVVRCTVQTRDQKTLAIIDFDPDTGAAEEVQRITDAHWVELQSGTPHQSELGVIMVVDDGDTRKVAVDTAPIDHGYNVRSLIAVEDGVILATVTTDGTDSLFAKLSLDGSIELLTSEHLFVTVSVGGPTHVVATARPDGDTVTVVHWGDGSQTTIDSFADSPGFASTPTFHQLGTQKSRTALCLPADHDGSPLPVLLDPYGGPHAQRVLRSRNAYATSQWFAEQGFAVVIIDGRGTPNRGPAFEREIWGNFASKVLDDQIDALHALAETRSELDLSRVGIRGWSFGGYLAALAVMRRPDAVHAAVSGAPVTDWRLYDTHYTERYIGHPDEYPENYERSGLMSDAVNLERPLMLIHGLADDNVVAAHTLKLSQALLEAGRPHEVLPLSGVTHMTPQEQVAENLLHLQRDFLLTHLSKNGAGA